MIVQNVEDLAVYQKLFNLACVIYDLTLTFPKFELFELGSQLRRASNAGPALLAEGFGNKHTNIYSENISRSMGEIKEIKHHLRMAAKRNYLIDNDLKELLEKYDECLKMLHGLNKSLMEKHRK